ncbi:MAG: polyphosphate kinase 2 family protein [Rhodobacteraceae bacterium]|nr:polyphosphate kinase 2 family protein [Paracoccaceae bacterium]
MKLSTALRVKPDAKVRLNKIDPGFSGAHESHANAAARLDHNLDRMTELQELLYAERKHALLTVLQGIDAAGTDGTCWHVLRSMNPQGTRVTGFKQPTPEERGHDFLWRIHKHTPALGEVAVFNRSHYEDVLVPRVHDLVPRSVWSKRYDVINDFERQLTLQGTTILKFFLWISPDEQLQRFKSRLDDPTKQWKISDADYSERGFWDAYVKAYEAMLTKCSPKNAPWYVIPSNHKWFRNLAVSEIIIDTLEGLKMKRPVPTVDLNAIRRKYHRATEE